MRFFKGLRVSILALALANGAYANDVVDKDQVLTPEDAIKMAADKGYFDGLNLTAPDVSENMKKIIENANQQSRDILNKQFANGRQVANGRAQPQEDAPVRPSDKMCMFVSMSMPRTALIDALKNAAASGITVYINGMFEGDKNILDTKRKLMVLTQDFAIVPNIKFGPSWFEKYHINKVPAMLYDDGKSQYTLFGHTLTEFFQERMESNPSTSNLGVYGNTYEVKEPSLIDQIQQLMAGIDWENKGKIAVERYWKKRKFVRLATAAEDSIFYIDPTVTITEDVFNGRGDLLAKAGTKFNPLNTMAGAYIKLYIIDPTDDRQLTWLDSHAKQFTTRDQVIATQLDKSRGWDNLSELRQRYKQNIYLLEDNLVQRFALKHVPSIVSIDRGYLKIQEYGMNGQ